MNRVITGVLVLSTLVLMGCGDAAAPQENPEPQVQGIEWFEGDVEEAFASAKELGKPVFLYWGAVWCPPCHNLKKNIFTKAEFIEASKRFVPVYLDGDTERAQIWAENFKIAGYPTVILFSPTGVELFRMPSDVTMEQYGTLLEAAISDFRPVEQVLEEVIATGPHAADRLDLELIAFHSWAQDPNASLTDAEALDVFWRFYIETPVESERLRARFMILTLERAVPRIGVVSEIFGEGELAALDDERRVALRWGLVKLLNTPSLWPENKIFLTLQSSQAIGALEPEPAPTRDELVELWLSSADAMQNHPDFSATEQLMAFVPEFELLPPAEVADGKIPSALREKVKSRAESVVAGSHDPGEFQSTLNMVVWLLTMSGLQDEAKTLLDEYMDQTVAPHYFLSLLGDLTADNPEAALEWHRQAFERSGQGSSRVKWGSSYVLKLIQSAPEDALAIDAASREVIAEFVTSEDAFAGRNHAYLQNLERGLLTWADETGNQAVIEGLRGEVLKQCDRFKDELDSAQYERCLAFLQQ